MAARAHGLVVLLAGLLVATLHAGCFTTCTADCVDPSLTVQVPEDRAADVAGVDAQGTACQANPVLCVLSTTPGRCTFWVASLRAAGTCTVVVHFRNAPDFVATTSAAFHEGSCGCSGFFPTSQSAFQVPSLADGGVADAAGGGAEPGG